MEWILLIYLLGAGVSAGVFVSAFKPLSDPSKIEKFGGVVAVVILALAWPLLISTVAFELSFKRKKKPTY